MISIYLIDRLKQLIKKSFTLKLIFLIVIIKIFITSCTIRLVSDYDSFSDELVMQLYTDYITFFVNLERSPEPPDCEYEFHKNFYVKVQVTISVLIQRNKSRKDSDEYIEYLGKIQKQFERIEEIHRTKGCISADSVKIQKQNIDLAFDIFFKYENKKREEKGFI